MEWILAFDAGCGSCRSIADAIRRVVEGRVDIAALTDERIVGLRRRALGPTPPFAPTLLRVDATGVRAWTGPALSLRLARLLGPARSIQVARILNRNDAVRHGRRALLKAVPGAAAGAFLITGGLAAPAMASPSSGSECREAQAWVDANRDRLPSTYDEFVTFSATYRRAIFVASDPAVRRHLWRAQLGRFREGSPGLSPSQSAALAQAERFLGTLSYDPRTLSTDRAAADDLRQVMIGAFGRHEAARLIARLGPEDPARPVAGDRTTALPTPGCECNAYSDWCNDSSCIIVYPRDCVYSDLGCGTGWLWSCNGMCR